MRVKLFTHTDLDGVSCSILSKIAYKNVDVEYCSYDNIDKKVQDFIKRENGRADKVFITDISINEKTANMIEENYQSYDKLELNHIILLDHHQTALWLNKYTWCKVQVEDKTEKICGAKMMYNFLKKNGYIEYNETLDSFIEKVNRYDTWLWKEKYNDDVAKMLNDLLYIYGRESFERNMVYKIINNEKLLSLYDLAILDLEESKIDRYVQSKSEKMIIKELKLDKVYKFGVVTGEQYISELGNRLSENNPDLDFIAIVNFNIVSLRTTKDSIDVGFIAKKFGGGGHSKASGFSYKMDLDKIFNIE